MITIIDRYGNSVSISITEAATRAETAFRAMVRAGQKLCLGQNPASIAFYPYFLANRHAPGPATIFTGSVDEIKDLMARIGQLILSEEYLPLFEI